MSFYGMSGQPSPITKDMKIKSSPFVVGTSGRKLICNMPVCGQMVYFYDCGSPDTGEVITKYVKTTSNGDTYAWFDDTVVVPASPIEITDDNQHTLQLFSDSQKRRHRSAS